MIHDASFIICYESRRVGIRCVWISKASSGEPYALNKYKTFEKFFRGVGCFERWSGIMVDNALKNLTHRYIGTRCVTKTLRARALRTSRTSLTKIFKIASRTIAIVMLILRQKKIKAPSIKSKSSLIVSYLDGIKPRILNRSRSPFVNAVPQILSDSSKNKKAATFV